MLFCRHCNKQILEGETVMKGAQGIECLECDLYYKYRIPARILVLLGIVVISFLITLNVQIFMRKV